MPFILRILLKYKGFMKINVKAKVFNYETKIEIFCCISVCSNACYDVSNTRYGCSNSYNK